MLSSKLVVGALLTVVAAQSVLLTRHYIAANRTKSSDTTHSQAHGALQPARLEPLGNSGLKRIILTEKAARRLDITTAAVQEQTVARKRLLVGEVVTTPIVLAKLGSDRSAKALVRLLQSNELNGLKVQTATVAAIGQPSASGVSARRIDIPNTADKDKEDKEKEGGASAYYAIEEGGARFNAGQRVQVEFAVESTGAPRKIVPYTSIIYDAKGAAWVYTNPDRLTFVRHPVTIDYVAGDIAVLTDGPLIDTAIVTVGSMELYGTEYFVGH